MDDSQTELPKAEDIIAELARRADEGRTLIGDSPLPSHENVPTPQISPELPKDNHFQEGDAKRIADKLAALIGDPAKGAVEGVKDFGPVAESTEAAVLANQTQPEPTEDPRPHFEEKKDSNLVVIEKALVLVPVALASKYHREINASTIRAAIGDVVEQLYDRGDITQRFEPDSLLEELNRVLEDRMKQLNQKTDPRSPEEPVIGEILGVLEKLL